MQPSGASCCRWEQVEAKVFERKAEGPQVARQRDSAAGLGPVVVLKRCLREMFGVKNRLAGF